MLTESLFLERELICNFLLAVFGNYVADFRFVEGQAYWGWMLDDNMYRGRWRDVWFHLSG